MTAAAEQLQLQVLPGTYVDGGTARSLDLLTRVEGDALAVEVRVQQARNLKALYCELSCAQGMLELVSAAPGAAFGDPGQVLCLVEPDRTAANRLWAGAVLANWPERQGFSGDGVVLSLRLRLARATSAPRTVSMPPRNDAARVTLSYDTGELRWYYGNPGDYDQNGEVNISDLTPLGANIGKTGPFDFKSVLWCIDGDHNDEINIADLTPIGSNFGNQVEGYIVYYSSVASDYPPTNVSPNGATSVPAHNEPLSDAGGGPNERKWFSASIPAPLPSEYYWVRSYDQGDEGTPSELFNSMAFGSWHVYDVAGGTPGADEAGQYASLALVNGRPAIAYYVGEPYYVRAEDDRGTSWPADMCIFSDMLDCGSYISLAVINGLPAVAYYTDDNGYPAYLQATDADGTAWGTPVVIESGAYAQSMSLAEVNGRPAVAYATMAPGPLFHLLYERARDSSGLDWGDASLDIDEDITLLASPQLALISGLPSVAFRAQPIGPAIMFKRADDVSGLTWSSFAAGAYWNAGLLATGSIDVCEVDGRAAMCFVHQSLTGSRPYYTRAFEVGGATWDSPAPQSIVSDTAYVIDDYMSMAVVGSSLYCAMANYTTHGLDCARADDSTGTVWNAPQQVDSGNGNIVGHYCSMADINGYPAVAYYDVDNAALKYAVFF